MTKTVDTIGIDLSNEDIVVHMNGKALRVNIKNKDEHRTDFLKYRLGKYILDEFLEVPSDMPSHDEIKKQLESWAEEEVMVH